MARSVAACELDRRGDAILEGGEEIGASSLLERRVMPPLRAEAACALEGSRLEVAAIAAYGFSDRRPRLPLPGGIAFRRRSGWWRGDEEALLLRALADLKIVWVVLPVGDREGSSAGGTSERVRRLERNRGQEQELRLVVLVDARKGDIRLRVSVPLEASPACTEGCRRVCS